LLDCSADEEEKERGRASLFCVLPHSQRKVVVGWKRDDAKKERKKRIYICKKKKKLAFRSLFCSTNWLAAERPQRYTKQCQCKDLIIIIDDGIKKNEGEIKTCIEEWVNRRLKGMNTEKRDNE